MTATATPTFQAVHSHVFLGEGHEINERKAWGVILLCGGMMLVEIVGGLMFGSIALVADGMHMSTHAGAQTSICGGSGLGIWCHRLGHHVTGARAAFLSQSARRLRIVVSCNR